MTNARTAGRWSVLGAACLVLVTAGAAPAGAAGTASLDGATARFTDPVGAADDLAVNVESIPLDSDADRIGGWRVGFLQHDPATAPGAGCHAGFVATVCPTGETPSGAAIDLGAGDDQLRLYTAPAFPGQRVALAGGPGDDRVQKYQTTATIDLGPGDDTIEPDAHWTVFQMPPAATPGDVIGGGTGTDTVDYTPALDPIDVSLNGKADDGRKGERDDVRPDVENVVGSELGGTLVGSDAANALTGGPGADRIVGGAGGDQLDGRGGNDVLDALDGRGGDKVTCGDGADVAYVDGGDVLASQDVRGGAPCERVVYAPAVSTSSLRRRSKRVAVRLTCPKASRATCAGTLRLTTTKGRRLASAGYRARRGRTTTVGLRVVRKPARAARLLVAPKGTAPVAGRAVSIR